MNNLEKLPDLGRSFEKLKLTTMNKHAISVYTLKLVAEQIVNLEQSAEIKGVVAGDGNIGLIVLVKNKPGGTTPTPIEIYSSDQWFQPSDYRRYAGSAVVAGVLVHVFYLIQPQGYEKQSNR
jgi:hypothetical protein